jgi:uncharacterized membrane protein (DUF4010 family)
MDINLLQKVQPFALALALGLIIGIEREQSHPPGYQPLGLRTFILFSILGSIAASLSDPWFTASITLFVSAIIVAGYLRSSIVNQVPDIGITTEVAAVVTYALGFLAFKDPFPAVILGVVVLVVLLARTRLHTFSRTQLRPEELKATAMILVVAVCILPLLPDHTIDPWHVFNPLKFGGLVLAIALLQFCAYAGIRIFGTTYGLLLSGFLAGFVSSTAATVNLASAVKKKTAPPLTAATAVMLSTVALFIKVLVILFIASPALFYAAASPSIVTALVSALVAITIGYYVEIKDHFPQPTNPLALFSALRLAAFLAGMVILVSIANYVFGQYGLLISVFLGGLVELNGVILAVATLFQKGQITQLQAINQVGFAIMASFVSKYLITWIMVINRYTVYVTVLLGMMIVLYCAAWFAIIK